MTEIDNLGTPSLPRVILTQAFGAVGNRTSVSANVAGTNDYQNDYQYDGLHRMTQVTQQEQTGGNAVAEKRVDFSYNNLGQFTEITRYSDLVGTNEVATSTYQYDTNARLEDLTHQHDTTTIAQYTWTYDNLNRISSFTSPDADVTYQYDETGQLTGADYDTASGITDESYQYDLAGNRINTGYSTGDNNQLLSDGTYNYTYDNEGNRSTRTEIATGELTEYAWDHRNRLTSVITKNSGGTITHQVDYTYDVFNRRIIKSIDSDGAGSGTATEERYIYDGDHIALVYDESNQLTNRLLHGPAIDQVLADEQFINGLFDKTLWPLTDHLGSVRDLVDNDGNIENHIVYDSFGNIISETDSSIDHLFGYTGRETDEETDLYYYRARYYDAEVGRFVSEDPIGFRAGDVNIARYVWNAPQQHVDPDGLDDLRVVEETNYVFWDIPSDSWWSWGPRESIWLGRLNADGKTITISDLHGGGTISKAVLDKAIDDTDLTGMSSAGFTARQRLLAAIEAAIDKAKKSGRSHGPEDSLVAWVCSFASSGGDRDDSANARAKNNRNTLKELKEDLNIQDQPRDRYNEEFAEDVKSVPFFGWVSQTLFGPEKGDTADGLKNGAGEMVLGSGLGLLARFRWVPKSLPAAPRPGGTAPSGDIPALMKHLKNVLNNGGDINQAEKAWVEGMKLVNDRAKQFGGCVENNYYGLVDGWRVYIGRPPKPGGDTFAIAFNPQNGMIALGQLSGIKAHPRVQGAKALFNFKFL